MHEARKSARNAKQPKRHCIMNQLIMCAVANCERCYWFLSSFRRPQILWAFCFVSLFFSSISAPISCRFVDVTIKSLTIITHHKFYAHWIQCAPQYSMISCCDTKLNHSYIKLFTRLITTVVIIRSRQRHNNPYSVHTHACASILVHYQMFCFEFLQWFHSFQFCFYLFIYIYDFILILRRCLCCCCHADDLLLYISSYEIQCNCFETYYLAYKR